MKKYIIFFIALIIIGCSIYYYQITKIERGIVKQFQETNELDFSKINTFNWDKIIILGPYHTIKECKKKI